MFFMVLFMGLPTSSGYPFTSLVASSSSYISFMTEVLLCILTFSFLIVVQLVCFNGQNLEDNGDGTNRNPILGKKIYE